MPSYLINQTFFVGDLVLPNTHHQAEIDKINAFIAKFEPKCLLSIFGYPLFKAFSNESSQRMTDLLDGAEYTDGCGNTQKWSGLIHDTSISLIANYVYFYILEASSSTTTGTGTTITKQDSGNAVSPAYKMEKAWNFFSDEVYSMTSFLWLKKNPDGSRSYPEFTYHQFLETRRISRKINAIFSF